MKVGVALILLLVGLLGLVWFAKTASNVGEDVPVNKAAAQAPAAGTVMPASAFKLDDYKGQVVVMDFWATWCGPCKMAMPGVQKLHEKFAGRPVRVFGMDCWERGGDPAAYMKSKGYTYTLVTGTDSIARGYGVQGIPHFVVIGVKGEQLLSQSGYSPDNEAMLAKVIEDHLAKNGL